MSVIIGTLVDTTHQLFIIIPQNLRNFTAAALHLFHHSSNQRCFLTYLIIRIFARLDKLVPTAVVDSLLHLRNIFYALGYKPLQSRLPPNFYSIHSNSPASLHCMSTTSPSIFCWVYFPSSFEDHHYCQSVPIASSFMGYASWYHPPVH